MLPAEVDERGVRASCDLEAAYGEGVLHLVESDVDAPDLGVAQSANETEEGGGASDNGSIEPRRECDAGEIEDMGLLIGEEGEE